VSGSAMLMMPAKSVIGEFSISVAVLNSGLCRRSLRVVTVEEVAGLIFVSRHRRSCRRPQPCWLFRYPPPLQNAEAGSPPSVSASTAFNAYGTLANSTSAALPRQSTEP